MLGQVAPRIAMLAVPCNRCDRRGRLATARLLAEHGAGLRMPELRRVIAADCPRMQAGRMHEFVGCTFRRCLGWSDNRVATGAGMV